MPRRRKGGSLDSKLGENRESLVTPKDAFHNLVTNKVQTVSEWKKSLSGMRGNAAKFREAHAAKMRKKSRGERY